MIKTGYFTTQQDKLVKQFKKLLNRYEVELSELYGRAFAEKIATEAMSQFIELIPRIPYYETPLYRPIILLNSKLIAIIKAMKKYGKPVEDVVKFRRSFSGKNLARSHP